MGFLPSAGALVCLNPEELEKMFFQKYHHFVIDISSFLYVFDTYSTLYCKEDNTMYSYTMNSYTMNSYTIRFIDQEF